MDGVTRSRENLIKSLRALRWYEWAMAAVMIVIAAYYMVLSLMHPGATENPGWLAILNFISGVAGVFCVFLCARASVSNFAFGLVNTVVYIVYLAYWRIYGTMCLELFLYLPMGVIGWRHWAGHRDAGRQETTIARRLSLWQSALVGGLVIAGTVAGQAILNSLGGTVAWLDAATVAIGIAATALQTFRYREQYALWLVTDVVTVAMYVVHFDPVYLTKRIIYLIVAVIGFVHWLRLSRLNPENR